MLATNQKKNNTHYLQCLQIPTPLYSATAVALPLKLTICCYGFILHKLVLPLNSIAHIQISIVLRKPFRIIQLIHGYNIPVFCPDGLDANAHSVCLWLNSYLHEPVTDRILSRLDD